MLAGCLALRAEDGVRSAAPSYSSSSVVNSVSFTAGWFAPYSPVTVFGTDLSFGAEASGGSSLPLELAGVNVSLEGQSVPLFYVSDRQINFLIPPGTGEGELRLRVIRSGVAGPEVALTVGSVAPALFRTAAGFAVAAHADGSLITPESPARMGEVIVLYAAGLGQTKTAPPARQPATEATEIAGKRDFRVLLDGTAIDASRVLYAGLSPGSIGLYQVNVVLPDNLGKDPEVRIATGDRASGTGVKLPVR